MAAAEGSVSAEELARLDRISPVLAHELLLVRRRRGPPSRPGRTIQCRAHTSRPHGARASAQAAEALGTICRDDTMEGLRFFENLFLVS